MNAAWFLCLFVLLKISQSESLTLQLSTSSGNRRTVSGPIFQRDSIPAVTIPVARQTLSTNVNIPTISADASIGTVYPSTSTVGSGTVFSGTPTTVGTAGIDVLRRGSELIADRIASALGGVAVLVDILRNTSVNGDVVWANLGSTSQALATRFLTIGMNTANTLLQELNGQLTINANPTNVLQNFLNIPSISQMTSVGSLSRSPQISNQVFFPNRVFTAAQQNNASGSVPTVGETLNNIFSNLSGALPNASTVPTVSDTWNNISGNLSGALPSASTVPSVGETLNNISGNLSGALPNASTIPTVSDTWNNISGNLSGALPSASTIPTVSDTWNNISGNLNGALPSASTVPSVGETLNNISSNLNDSLPSVTTLSTSRPGLNIPTTDNSVAENISSSAQNVNSEVETFDVNP